MTRVLLTAFEPFGGSPINPSADALRELAITPPAGLTLIPLVLPVDAAVAPALVRSALVRHRPHACVMLGQADGRAALSIERVAVNMCDFRIADNAGNQPIDQPVVHGGPTAYFSTLPVRSLREAAERAGVAAELSLSAGAYLCNMVLYTALHTCAVYSLAAVCGFVHVPALPIQRPDGPNMSLEAQITGLRAMLATLAERAMPRAEPALELVGAQG